MISANRFKVITANSAEDLENRLNAWLDTGDDKRNILGLEYSCESNVVFSVLIYFNKGEDL